MELSSSVDRVNLKINKVSREVYDYMRTSGLINENELYVVEDTFLDAHNKPIIYVGDPISSSDGANKKYVDEQSDKFVKISSDTAQELYSDLQSFGKVNARQFEVPNKTDFLVNGVPLVTMISGGGTGTQIYKGWNGNELHILDQLSIVNITRDDYYALPDNEKNLSGVQYIVSSDTYLNWPYQVSIDFLSSEYASQNTIVSCINSILSVFKYVNIDANQFLHLVTIPSLSSPVASQNDIVNTINTMLSAYKNQVGPIEIKGGDSSKVTIRTWND